VRFLLDTHAFAWAVGDPDRLGDTATATLREVDNELLVSPASIWEMSIKHHLGKWPEVAPFMDEQLYGDFTARLGVRELSIRTSHARLAGQFNVDHPDPFDRMLAAQALLEGIPIISKDLALDRFPVTRIW
jgi:PIN domain nuclease of toxin-antitoxin system